MSIATAHWTPGRLFGGGRAAAATQRWNTRERAVGFGRLFVGRRGNSDSPSGEQRVATRTRTRSPSWMVLRLRPGGDVHGGSRRPRPAGEHAAKREGIRGTWRLRLRWETDFTPSVSARGVSLGPRSSERTTARCSGLGPSASAEGEASEGERFPGNQVGMCHASAARASARPATRGARRRSRPESPKLRRRERKAEATTCRHTETVGSRASALGRSDGDRTARGQRPR
jgi:hypothetical protein